MMLRGRVVALALCLGACGGAEPTSVPSPELDAATDDASVFEDAAKNVPLDDVGDLSEVRDAGGSTASDVVDVTRPGSGPPYPVVLVHGFSGFRDLGPVNYYFRVAADFRGRGETVFESVVAPFASSAVRAAMLGRYLDTEVFPRTGAAKVILVAHSQGGLDARYLVSSLGYGDRVAAVVTIATPHRGTRIADAFQGGIPGATDGLLNAAASVLGFTLSQARSDANVRAALDSLSERNAEAFNRANPDDPRVLYWSFAGRTNRRSGSELCGDAVIANHPDRLDNTALVLAPFAGFLEQGDPTHHANDGMVEVRSARWGRFMGCTPTDHFDEVGQIAHILPDPETGFDHIQFYRDIVRRLRTEGL